MSRMKWVRYSDGYWYLRSPERNHRKLAELFRTPRGWVVVVRGKFAGPYGDFDLARQSAARRLEKA